MSTFSPRSVHRIRRSIPRRLWATLTGRPTRTCPYFAAPPKAKHLAADWASAVLADSTAVIVDTETVGLNEGHRWAVSIAVVDVATGSTVYETLINPQVPIPPTTTAIHGVSNEHVHDAPTFAQIADALATALSGRRIVMFNAEYDMGVLDDEYTRINSHNPFDAECAMDQYSRWVGDWNSARGYYRRQRLNGPHTAAADCRAVITVLHRMAAIPTHAIVATPA